VRLGRAPLWLQLADGARRHRIGVAIIFGRRAARQTAWRPVLADALPRAAGFLGATLALNSRACGSPAGQLLVSLADGRSISRGCLPRLCVLMWRRSTKADGDEARGSSSRLRPRVAKVFVVDLIAIGDPDADRDAPRRPLSRARDQPMHADAAARCGFVVAVFPPCCLRHWRSRPEPQCAAVALVGIR